MEINTRQILISVLETIEGISNKEYQKRAWIDNKVHPYAFFEESMHQLFDDYELFEVITHYKTYGISNDQHALLRKFYDILNQYSDEKMSWLTAVDPKEILADSRWHDIQKMAKEVLKAFNYPENSN